VSGDTVPGDTVPVDTVPVDTVQAALAAEHAAVWAYDLASAFVTGSAASQLRDAASTHQARRDATQRLLADAGTHPVPPEPGYLTPEPVTDTASAVRLAITVETDVAGAWRAVLERSAPGPAIRGPTTRGPAMGGPAIQSPAIQSPAIQSPAIQSPTIRALALDALVDSAVRASRWRASAGITPVTVPFPGTG
jgi:hypothetical protein